MSDRAAFNTVAVLSLAIAGAPAAAQSAAAAVQLSVIVPPRGSATSVGAPVARSTSEGLTEYVMRITVDANAPYRISARPSASLGGATLVRAADGQRVALRERDEVVVARGGRGVQTVELSYWVPADRREAGIGEEPPAYTITLEPSRRAP